MSPLPDTARSSSPAPRWLALALLAGAAWLLWAGQPAAKPEVPVAQVPERVGDWQGTPLPVEANVTAILETDDVSLMEYRQGQGRPPVWFAQVAGFGNRAAFHPPELCYVGSHFEILTREPIQVPVNGTPQRLMRLVIAQDGQQFESWYWFTAGRRTTASYYQQQLWLVLGSIRRHPVGGTLVRISTPLDDPEAAHARLLAFLTSFETNRTTAQQVPQ